MRTLKNILQHELIGLDCEVVGAENKSQVGARGRIADETMKTLVIESEGRKKMIQKKGSTFRITLGGKKADIGGDFIIARPEDRIKKIVRKW